jgi:hypothetical protein
MDPNFGKYASQGGKAKSARSLNVEKVEAAFGPLVTPEDAKSRLATISVWAVAGMVPGTVANAAVRAVEVWLKCDEAAADRERLKQAEKRISELEAEVADARQGRHRMEVV